MITHEEARTELEYFQQCVGLKLNKVSDYITQQEKVSKLLRLYQEKENHVNNWKNYDRSCDMEYIEKYEYLANKIKELEAELNENL